MCREGSHHCSNCDAELDSGKTGEYKVLDFAFEKAKGIIEKKRTIICNTCQKDAMMAEFIKMVEGLDKLPKYVPKAKAARGPGEMGCGKCGKLIKPFTPHVSLNIAWDVNYQKIAVKDNILCKDCYSRDKRTKAVWTFLAKLGKNPTFAPHTTCASAPKCATFAEGSPQFGCKFIVAEDYTRTVGRGSKKVKYAEHRLACARKHPKVYAFLTQDPHAKVITNLTSNPIATGLKIEVMVRKLKHHIKKMEKNAKKITDPALRVNVQMQIDMVKLSLGPYGLQP